MENQIVSALEGHAKDALEGHAKDALEGHAKDALDYPTIQQPILTHLEETKLHRQRMEDRLRSYNKPPSGAKGAVSNLTGAVTGAIAGARSQALAQNARDEYITEHMEIAVYLALIATARLAGDTETIQACEANLRDEARTARLLETALPQTMLLSLEKDNVSVPQVAGDEAVAATQAALQSAQWNAQQPPPGMAPQQPTPPHTRS